MRFDKFTRCDLKNNEKLLPTLKKLTIKRLDDPEDYPCFEEYFEAMYACSDQMFDFLMELHYERQMNNFNPGDIWNRELRRSPTVFDNPDGENIQYTY